MILFVDKDTTLFRSSSIRYRGWLYMKKHTLSFAPAYSMGCDSNTCGITSHTFNSHLFSNVCQSFKYTFQCLMQQLLFLIMDYRIDCGNSRKVIYFSFR